MCLTPKDMATVATSYVNKPSEEVTAIVESKQIDNSRCGFKAQANDQFEN
jgi:hypothetical protein